MKNVTIIEFSLSLRVPFCACRAALHVLFYAGAQAKNIDVALVSELVTLAVRTSYGHWYSNIEQLPPHISVGVWHLARRARKQKKTSAEYFPFSSTYFTSVPYYARTNVLCFCFISSTILLAQRKWKAAEQRDERLAAMIHDVFVCV